MLAYATNTILLLFFFVFLFFFSTFFTDDITFVCEPSGYVSLGGLRSSLVSDAIQALLALVLLFIVIGIIIPKARSDLLTWNPSPERNVFSLEGGMDLVIVGSLQVSSSFFSFSFSCLLLSFA